MSPFPGKTAMLLGAVMALGAVGVVAQPRPAAPAASAAAPPPGTDPGMIVRPPARVDPEIRERAPRNVDPGLVERPPVDAKAAAPASASRGPAAGPRPQPAR